MSKKDEILAEFIEETEANGTVENDSGAESNNIDTFEGGNENDDESSITETDEVSIEVNDDESETKQEESNLDPGDALLDSYGFEGGLLEWNDQEVRFSELEPDDQREVLIELLSMQGENNSSDEPTPSIPEEEKEAYSQFKELLESGNLEQVLNGQVSNSNEDISFEEMNDESIFRYDYLQSIPDDTLEEMSEEEIEEILQSEYEKAKDSKTFSVRMNTLRTKFAQEDEQIRIQEQEESNRQAQLAYEEQVKAFKEEADAIDTIMVASLDHEDREELYEKILTVDENGFSPFLKDIASNPTELMKAAFLYYKGQDMLDEIDDYYINKLKKAREASNDNVGTGSRLKTIVPRKGGDSPSSNSDDNEAKKASDIRNKRLNKIKL